MSGITEKILTAEQCAECKGCCWFDEDEWEAPEPLDSRPDSRSVCVHLTESGCALGRSKPLECSLYPFRVMQLGEYRVIALARYCKAVTDLPLSRLMEFVEELEPELELPKLLKAGLRIPNYDKDYVILRVIA
jgi:hypothetical protein